MFEIIVMTNLLDMILIPFSIADTTDLVEQIQEWGTELKTVLNATVALFGIVGGFIVFLQYMQGNDQAQKNFIKFMIGLAIMGLISLITGFFVVTPL